MGRQDREVPRPASDDDRDVRWRRAAIYRRPRPSGLVLRLPEHAARPDEERRPDREGSRAGPLDRAGQQLVHRCAHREDDGLRDLHHLRRQARRHEGEAGDAAANRSRAARGADDSRGRRVGGRLRRLRRPQGVPAPPRRRPGGVDQLRRLSAPARVRRIAHEVVRGADPVVHELALRMSTTTASPSSSSPCCRRCSSIRSRCGACAR